MSVINQMLNGLEQRGVTVATGQLRTVHASNKYRRVQFVLLAGLLVILAALLWRGVNGPSLITKQPVVAKVLPVAPVIPAISAIKPAAILPEKQAVVAPKVQPIKQAVMVPKVQPEKQAAPQVKTMPLAKRAAAPPALKAVAPAVPDANLPGAVKQVSLRQQAEAEFHKATVYMQQGRSIEAQAGLEAVLRMDAGFDAARHSLVSLLLESKRNTGAEQVLQEGLKIRPANSGYAMLLARLQVQRGELDQAIATLALTLPYAVQQADYQAFYAALLQRRARHKEAVEHYQVALKASPNSGVWLMGCGISLQALGKNDEAKEAFLRALSSKTLSAELQAFVQQKIKSL
ncbi:tetratricopeptide repeat protein [Gallionella capsiferriformans]|uniref:TPR repeat-containing protein n=1 Tax=Gallionella capsiferriformans (strain ES-2) TaxID=395494 RepID=D9SJ10_GALCS|nr:tetratricopeptide repeat protein [Gallionella capsiferriformans]ADL54286.1 TPR repeat-containing protein [Gallionella capsiferriformans ES-2]